MRLKKTLTMLAVLAVIGSQSALAVIVDPGMHYVPANTVVDLPILIFGWDDIVAVGLYVQIGDGGPTIGGTATHPDVPMITDVSLTAPGTIFAENNWGQFGGHTYPDFIGIENTITLSGTVYSRGILGYVTVDTTGAVAGMEYPFLLEKEGLMRTEVYPTDITELAPGFIHIIENPEPGTLALLAAASLVALRRPRTARRRAMG